jgi:thiamine biosynthesis lipoprotein
MRTFEGRAMGSPLRLSLPETAHAEAGWREVLDEFELSEEAMSRFRETSELTRLNRRAGKCESVVVSGRLRIALAAAERARRMTEGRFEPRVLVTLDRIGYRGAPFPRVEAMRDSRWSGAVVRRTGRAGLIIDHPIDLGGIGKGLAVRWATHRLERLGLSDFLLEAGGDLVTRGAAPDAGEWTIGIEDPFGGPDPKAVIALGTAGAAVATSSIRVHQWHSDGRLVHHLIDPVTGEPGGAGLQAVTVAGPDPAWAEVWSKSLFLRGAHAIGHEARSRGLAAWWVDDSGTLGMTPAARPMTAWVAGEG